MQILPVVLTLATLFTSITVYSQYHYYEQLDTDIELVQLIFRNGERRPYPDESYPLDPYASAILYDGRLTDLGRYRARRLGIALRRNYFNLLPNGLYSYSASLDSCMESLQEVVKALCAKECVSTKTIIPSREIDVVLNSKACSRYHSELDKLRRSAEVQKMLAKYDGLYRYITDKTGLRLDTADMDERIYKLYNLVESQKSMNLSLPDWCPEGVYGLLNEMTFVHYSLESQNDELRRLNSGPLVRRFLDAMTAPNTKAKIHLYSGEGHNVVALSRALNKRFPRVPNYGSAIILEKRREVETGRVFVRTMLWTGVSENMFPMHLGGCAELCPLDQFVRIVAETIPGEVELKCLLDDVGYDDHVVLT
ncbi:hypothetical protein TSAR_004665 [Trichomalopsis sarcophagae]|uniref:Uncharacterized protein n=1 Tax=Trichomalopsis sarcophagae TaxID=543379 RepID=A0A232EWU1_9HYME|nr:hypothetical protein TSAR_004665 [Trichomalopsis sarcophagae]